MIPAKFEYVRPGSVGEAVRALADGGEDAKVIAGGQSLLPLLRLRLAYPGLLADVAGLDELRGVTDAGDALLIGARSTHHQIVHDPLVAEHCGLLAEAAGTRGGLLRRLPDLRAGAGRDPDPHPGAQAGPGLGLPVREIPPDRAVVGHGGRGRTGPARQRDGG
jgi:aerobic carbon-monoxide dehydrogenase medium subunit